MTNRIRQMRGPGMNKGLKKPRHGKFSDTSSASAPRTKDSTPVAPGSLRSPNAGVTPRGNSNKPRIPRGNGPTYLSPNVWDD